MSMVVDGECFEDILVFCNSRIYILFVVVTE